MPGRFLLDTNAVIGLRDNDPRLIDLIPEADGAWISVVTMGELLYGALKSAKPEQGRRRLHAVHAGCSIAPCDFGTASAYAAARDTLRRKGRPIPENDIWIAATAIQHDLVLVTRDAHFDHVDGLAVRSW